MRHGRERRDRHRAFVLALVAITCEEDVVGADLYNILQAPPLDSLYALNVLMLMTKVAVQCHVTLSYMSKAQSELHSSPCSVSETHPARDLGVMQELSR